MNLNITWHDVAISQAERSQRNGHQSCVLWYTGLSGSGKSTIANAVDRLLFSRNCHTTVLDGDNIRHGLNSDLGFDDKSRYENIRRIGEVSKLFVESGVIVSSAFISPFRAEREMVRNLLGIKFIEIYVATPLDICEERDPKGLYLKARNGVIQSFTGVSSSYEPPVNPEIYLDTSVESVKQCVEKIIGYLETKHYI